MDLQQSINLKIDAVIEQRKELLSLKHLASDLDSKMKDPLSVIVENMNHLIPKELELLMNSKIRDLQDVILILIDRHLLGTNEGLAFKIGAYQIFGFDSWIALADALKGLKEVWNNILNVEIEQFNDCIRIILTLPEKP